MRQLHILTIAGNLPLSLLDRVLTATEQSLRDLGVSRVWITSDGGNLKVLAEIPADTDSDLGNGVGHNRGP
ncbi:hypothetical protein ASC77_18645 [Nocardioides sp. Root1257]|uniref:hypothetical protein n=1 Tax=unclassified Nocardioides TaxID=2615069 RepID=UPI0006F2B6F1|nr:MULTISPECIES: hypothetical protein [unclassified Nocardioides]KQW45936.1 hypothetical protein ASC77_18645 [Nocardioides sp. Root1257]KRC43200.1 hypothetical protein ASE24_19610 [Nocardioides sp. Root224]